MQPFKFVFEEEYIILENAYNYEKTPTANRVGYQFCGEKWLHYRKNIPSMEGTTKQMFSIVC